MMWYNEKLGMLFSKSTYELMQEKGFLDGRTFEQACQDELEQIRLDFNNEVWYNTEEVKDDTTI